MDEKLPVESKSVISLHPPMKVNDLIKVLGKYPQDAQVCQGEEYDTILVTWTDYR